MKLLIKQRFFALFDHYDVYNEDEEKVYTVKGQLALAHCLKIYDARGQKVGTVKQQLFTHSFDIYLGHAYIGCVDREPSFLRPKYYFDYNGWQTSGDVLGLNYQIIDCSCSFIAHISRERWHCTDTYVINLTNPTDTLCALMLALAIDADKCSKSN